MPHFTGTIIEESLEKKDVLREVKIIETKVEKAIEEHKTPWIAQWTLHKVEIPEEDVDMIAEKLSASLDSKHDWYADFKNDTLHYIIFRNKIFRIDRSKPEEYDAATQYGLTLGIPSYQLDFSPAINEWKK